MNVASKQQVAEPRSFSSFVVEFSLSLLEGGKDYQLGGTHSKHLTTVSPMQQNCSKTSKIFHFPKLSSFFFKDFLTFEYG